MHLKKNIYTQIFSHIWRRVRSRWWFFRGENIHVETESVYLQYVAFINIGDSSINWYYGTRFKCWTICRFLLPIYSCICGYSTVKMTAVCICYNIFASHYLLFFSLFCNTLSPWCTFSLQRWTNPMFILAMHQRNSNDPYPFIILFDLFYLLFFMHLVAAYKMHERRSEKNRFFLPI